MYVSGDKTVKLADLIPFERLISNKTSINQVGVNREEGYLQEEKLHQHRAKVPCRCRLEEAVIVVMGKMQQEV